MTDALCIYTLIEDEPNPEMALASFAQYILRNRKTAFGALQEIDRQELLDFQDSVTRKDPSLSNQISYTLR